MIAIIDYGLSNLLSVKRAFDLYSQDVTITNDKKIIERSEKLVLPGVGSFKNGMDALNRLGLSEVILREVAEGKVILGICLGMQMLFERSSEGGDNQGLGLLKGNVQKIPLVDTDELSQNVPHVGWNELYSPEGKNFENTIFENVPLGGEVYFVHSYECKVAEEKDVLAYTSYGGRNICAAVKKNNVYGCQFHPEKSGSIGLQIIKKYLEI